MLLGSVTGGQNKSQVWTSAPEGCRPPRGHTANVGCEDTSLHTTVSGNTIAKKGNSAAGLSPEKQEGEPGQDEEEGVGLVYKGRQSGGGDVGGGSGRLGILR